MVIGNATEEFLKAQAEINATFARNWEKRNAEALCRDYYTDDALISGTDMPIVVGMDNLIECWKEVMRDSPLAPAPRMKLEPALVWNTAEYAFDVGRFYFYFEDSSTDDLEGRYHLGWMNVPEKGWRVHVDFWAAGLLGDV